MTTTIQSVPRNLPAPTSAAAVTARLLACAASQIGYREGRDPDGDWNNDNAYGLYFNQNRVSWCHWFVSWAAVAAGIPATVIPRTGYTPTGWNFFRNQDRDVTSPRAGDIFYVYGPVAGESQPRVHHVGIVEKVLSDGRIQSLEGNTNTSGSSQGNGVYRLTRTVSSKLRFARPDYAAAVQVAPPVSKPPATKPPTPEDDMQYTPEQLEQYAGQGVHGQKIGRSGVTIGQALDSTRKDAAAARAMLGSLSVQVGGLTAAVQALAQNQGVDPAAILAAVTAATEQGVDKVLADLKITLAVDDDEPATPEA